ncbi:LLM class flavin-dependent oxidoreductase [Yinghuangia seranimata]|uniref:LLM class flavin-dependent oxidoreductase n=1 Tax=Yinghuangia seranimata TaxID=408067 RepID=UPI00248B7E8F|nr:LLM class flavin-dependent oxidoreductase [Yinghuangia seranimata]MDI2129851.1 LLM class flavin-dependent oxidoreductase [Yinghuangia seranimata]
MTGTAEAAAFADGSISMRIYPHNDLDAPGIAAELCAQAGLAAEAGFDGVMTSEHHGGFAGYLPNPLQVTGWLLDRTSGTPGFWAAPCPMLLPLRPVAMLAEEVAWLAARCPGRVGIGVAPGALALDFRVMDLDHADAMPRFRAGLPRLAALLRGEDLGELAGDRALSACAAAPVPVVSTAMSPAAVRRAAACGTGVLYDGASTPERLSELTGHYVDAGGTGPRVLIRRVWLGDPPREAFEQQRDVYRSYSPAAAQRHWRDTGFLCHDTPEALAAELLATWRDTGATCLNLRVHVPGVDPEAAREQIAVLGREVVPLLRDASTRKAHA